MIIAIYDLNQKTGILTESDYTEKKKLVKGYSYTHSYNPGTKKFTFVVTAENANQLQWAVKSIKTEYTELKNTK